MEVIDHENGNRIFVGDNVKFSKENISLSRHTGRDLKNNSMSAKTITKTLSAILYEQKNIFIGEGGMFSFNVVIRNTDYHPIYAIKDGRRINFGKSVFIGDHVWLGLTNSSAIGSPAMKRS